MRFCPQSIIVELVLSGAPVRARVPATHGELACVPGDRTRALRGFGLALHCNVDALRGSRCPRAAILTRKLCYVAAAGCPKRKPAKATLRYKGHCCLCEATLTTVASESVGRQRPVRNDPTANK